MTRSLTSIYYIEDIDSLRFALSLHEYDVLNLQPHFPGYPLFCFIAKLFYLIIGNKGLTFSVIGGISVFFCMYYCLKISSISPKSKVGFFVILIILLNPLFWLMSNRYMPDLLGLAVALGALYYLVARKRLSLGFFIFGLLPGIRLSFLPLLFAPIFSNLLKNKNKLLLVTFSLLGISVWLVPFIYLTGFENLWSIGLKHTYGHFNDYGGTIYTETNWGSRFTHLFKSVWADGLSGYWSGRSMVTIITSAYLLYFFSLSLKSFQKIWKDKSFRIILFSMIIYILWIIFFQNIIHKSRHVLPIIFFLILFISLGQKFNQNREFNFYLNASFFPLLLFITCTLVIQHKKPSAVSQMKDYLLKLEKPIKVVTIPLINYYLNANRVKTEFYNVENQEDIFQLNNSKNFENYYVIGNFRNLFNNRIELIYDRSFYHNPYVNRMWSRLDIYSMNSNELHNEQ